MINSILFGNRFSVVFVNESTSFFINLALNCNSGTGSFNWDRIEYSLVDNVFWIVKCFLCFGFFKEFLNLFVLYLDLQTDFLVLNFFEFENFFLNENSWGNRVKICWEVDFYKRNMYIYIISYYLLPKFISDSLIYVSINIINIFKYWSIELI